jgi:predicted deacetylase
MNGKTGAAQRLGRSTTRAGVRDHSHGIPTPAPISVADSLPQVTLRSATGARHGHANRRIAVALHDVEPATFERCSLLREWLEDRGVDRVTLLVIPARDLHPLGERSPAMIDWLAARRRAGDSIAQHGFQHEQLRRGAWSQRMLTPARSRRAAEFIGLDGAETRRAVEAGWRVLKLAGIEPDGFVAPAYAYTRALRGALASDGTFSSKFRWWAGLLQLHAAPGDGAAPRRMLTPAWGLASKGLTRRVFSPAFIRAGALLSGETLRLDLHPQDLEHPRHVAMLEQVLDRTRTRRRAITYNELAASSI